MGRSRAALLAFLVAFAGISTADTPTTFRAAKRAMARVYEDHRVTFYCGCNFLAGRSIDAEGCGYVPERETVRSRRIEWEHVVPAARLVEKFECKNREWCRDNVPDFRRAEADPMNLVPAIGELNAVRRDYGFGIIRGEPRRWGRCDFEVESGVAEPAQPIRGDIARIWLYMANRYQLILTQEEWWRFVEWSDADPIDSWERERRRRIEDL